MKVVNLARERRIRRNMAELADLLSNNPALAERAMGALQGQFDCNGLEDDDMGKHDAEAMIRMPKEWLERAEALVPAVEKDPAHVLARVTRAYILRLAILRGLEALEAEHGGKRRKR